MRKPTLLLLLGIAIAQTGCVLAPKYVRPPAPVPAAWPAGPAYPKSETPAAATAVALPPWQEVITDEKLRQVIQLALTSNRDLHLAVLSVQRAQALYDIKRADLLPAVNAVGSGSRQRLPADLSSTGNRHTSAQYGANLGISSWELDFFGRVRNLRDRALEEYLATDQARRNVEILLVSAVANAYLALAADRECLTLAETTLANQQDAYKLTKRRLDLGLVPELDLYRAQTQVDAARGDVAGFTQRVAQDENALSLLVGAPLPGAVLPVALASVAAPAEVSAGLSSEVLLRRPDVLQSESLLKAANADIGAARAAFLPRIALTAAVGTASRDLTGLFTSGSGTWSYAPQIVMPIFDARTWSAHRVAKVQQEIAVAQYEKALQNAFREVADALALQGTIGEQLAAQQSMVKAVSESYRLSTARYDKGVDNYLGVLDAQRSLYAAQQRLVSLRFAHVSNSLTLYKVLGGGAR